MSFGPFGLTVLACNGLKCICQILLRYFGHKNNIVSSIVQFMYCAQLYNHIYLCPARYTDSRQPRQHRVLDSIRMEPHESGRLKLHKLLKILTIPSSRLFIYLFNFLGCLTLLLAAAVAVVVFPGTTWFCTLPVSVRNVRDELQVSYIYFWPQGMAATAPAGLLNFHTRRM